ncbi:hypothetical protein CYMTET_21079 [Cymbomonas tetramitiformis]|uniref:RING-type domain-containing protein n=1 Tax=Cymbomonas tetramitiformis TaxID=36881 RepID=A0AAE0L3I5_9CHLO|nr:hypothetical protein CYMTET_21079 [Cymbomonas tetramitiformis]
MGDLMNEPTRALDTNFSDFECTLCLKLLCIPVTTYCGHSFCEPCLKEAVLHKKTCPVCRSPVEVLPARSVVLSQLLQCSFPQQYGARQLEVEQALQIASEAARLPRDLPLYIYPEVFLPEQAGWVRMQQQDAAFLEYVTTRKSGHFVMMSAEVKSPETEGGRTESTRVGAEVEITGRSPQADGSVVVDIKACRRVATESDPTEEDGVLMAKVRAFLDGAQPLDSARL